jgi:hypothetical protein
MAAFGTPGIATHFAAMSARRRAAALGRAFSFLLVLVIVLVIASFYEFITAACINASTLSA